MDNYNIIYANYKTKLNSAAQLETIEKMLQYESKLLEFEPQFGNLADRIWHEKKNINFNIFQFVFVRVLIAVNSNSNQVTSLRLSWLGALTMDATMPSSFQFF
jgi:hypothetical protein